MIAQPRNNRMPDGFTPPAVDQEDPSGGKGAPNSPANVVTTVAVAQSTSNLIPPAVAEELTIFREARVNQKVDEFEVGRKLLEVIPVRKPEKTTWIRTHYDSGFWFDAYLLLDGRTHDSYFLARPVWEALMEAGEKAITRKVLVPTMSRNGVLAVWPIGVGGDGSLNSWSESALTAAVKGRTQWVRVAANMELGAYEVRVRPSDAIEPKWPNLDIQQILSIAFKGRLITSLDHPLIRELQGLPTNDGGMDRLNALLSGSES